jgi:hemolysin activation/secretion protein
VVVNLTHRTVTGGVTADNRGSRFLGQYQGGVFADVNNVMGRFDRTQVRGISTLEFDELRYGEAVHEQQIGSEGTRVALAASHTATNPGSKLEDLDIQGENRSFTLGVTHPFIRSRQSNLFGNFEFDVRDSDVSALGFKLYEDKLRVFRVGGAYDFIDRWSAVNRMELTLSKGTGIWDTDSGIGARSRANGRPNFMKANVEVTRLQPITGPFSLYAAVAGQVANEPLLAAEEFGLGGATYGTAYDPSEVTGDHGVIGRLELQYNELTEWRFLPNYQLYTFYDLGKVWNKDPLPGDDSPASLASAGFGMRFNVLEDLSGGFELAVPLTREVNANGQDGDDPRFFFSFAYRY